MKKLAESMGLIAHEHSKQKTGIANKVIDQARQFYWGDDTARHMPGKQDVLKIRDENGKRKEQKGVLTMTISEVYHLLKEEHPELAIGKENLLKLDLKKYYCHHACQGMSATASTIATCS